VDPSDVAVAALFLEGAEVVLEAVTDPAVTAAWAQPSVLEDQTVGGLAGHLARGAVWLVGDYLDLGTPNGPADYATPVEYFVGVLGIATAADHQAVRERGAAMAAVGPEALGRDLRERLAALRDRLAVEDLDRLVAVIGGRTLRLATYLPTRIVEQAVHLDDLARSIGRDPWPYPEAAADVAIGIAVELATASAGRPALLRALYRRGETEPALPVL
jgi:uncharacterized protein (TIGR03083 family)